MRANVDISLKSIDDAALKTNSDLIMRCIDTKNKNWTPFKIKKVVVDHIKSKLQEEPKSCSAAEKLMALKLLNKAVMKRNQEFNRYVEANVLELLAKLA